MKGSLKWCCFKAFSSEFEMVRGPKIELYSNDHVDKVFLWLNLL